MGKWYNGLKKDLSGIFEDGGFVNFLKRRYKLLILIVLIPIFIGAGVLINGTMKINTKEEVLNKVILSLNSNDAKELSKVLYVSSKKVSSDELKPLLDYYDSDEESKKKVIEDLTDSGKSEFLEIKSEEKIFGENFYVDLKSFNINIAPTVSDAKVKLNGKDVESGVTLGKIIPGKYVIQAVAESEFGDIVKEENIDILKSKDIKIVMPATKLTISSEFNDAKVFINGKDTEKEVKDFKNYGVFPTDGSVSVKLVKEFPWGEISTEEVKITDTKMLTLKFEMMNGNLKTELEGIMDEFFRGTFDALNKKDKNLITNTYPEAKDRIYDKLKKNSWIFKNTYSLNELKTSIDQSDIFYEKDSYKARISTTVNYKVSKIMDLFQENKESKFEITIIYFEGTWLVEDVQVIE